ncbi:hypothetical protein [Ectothiorhodospira variabilis]|uniref:hypothetical protein n=1 Tax=Ectothiorhodospira variabilis TaxID=505694 RepID=UPI001EFC1B90|nr:hypothetical protein [Ectothiorhodospira variabilis]MCG5495547.1 hypothetical protein [Ectothiorhodospira variabilis]MCG5505155.1 hypothetical protein [Ectothiorhodospira variabilis]MCG5508312.1 hypothetical protein [Ectothiorhodospira variabilis]
MANDPQSQETRDHPPRPEVAGAESGDDHRALPPLDEPEASGSETPQLQPPPKGLIIGGGAIVILLVVSAVMLFGGGGESDPVAYEVDGAGALAGDVEADDVAPLADATVEAVEADDLSALPMEHADHQPDAGRLDDLAYRLEMAEDQLARLDERMSMLITSVDQLLDETPWEAAGNGQAPLNDEKLADLSERVAALQGTQDDLKALGRRVAGLESAHRAATRARASRPPFTLVAIDYWDNRPYATLESDGRHARLSEGDRLSGWQLHRLDPPNREARFIRPDGRMVSLSVEG